MISVIKKIYKLLLPAEQRRGSLLLLMVLIMAILDTAGVASIAPFMAVIANPDVVSSNVYLSEFYDFSGFSRVDNKPIDIEDFMFLLGVMVFFIMLLSTLFKAWTIYTLERYAQQCNFSLGRQLVSGYLRQSYSWFLNRHSSDIGKAILSEANAVISGALFPLIMVIAYSAVTLSIMILLMIVDPWLAMLVGSGLGGIYVVTYFFLRKHLSNLGEDRVLANKERFKIIQEGFTGIKDIKIYGLENTLLNRFDGPSLRYAKHTATQHIIGKMPRFLMEILAFGGMLLVILYLMKNYDGFSEIIPILALYTLAAYRLMPALQQVYSQVTTLRFSTSALNILYDDLELLNQPGIEELSLQEAKPLGINQHISLSDINFQYPGQGAAAINGISLNIPVKTTVGFVGSTGSGKTTIVDIILGLLQPNSGCVAVDNILINSENVRAWQKTIGYVPQQIYLSDDTIAANIAFGHDPNSIDYEAVESAAKIANLHEFIIEKLPNGYHTKVGEQGVRLSGGQRQRIGIARALYYNPEVLVFDEATSALDSVTERAVMEAVHRLGQKKTIIMIAHRLSTIQECDCIYILEGGKIEDQGTFNELIERNTSFKNMSEGK
jgi:ABC-type multidrug transport system fused ATPase/permease subunit